jgi:DNA (cytosine-5)-methyltransferase 1
MRQLNINYKVVATCDCDKDAVLSYAAMRNDLNNEIASYHFPSAEDMIFELQNKNVGYDFMKGKHTITTRTPIEKLKQYYLADKLSKNLGDIGKVERLPYADMVTYSFPCTDLSVAGKGEGMQNKCDACGHSWPIDFSNTEEMLICPNCGQAVSSSTRSGLLGQVQRLLAVAYENNELPKYLLLENVKNLVGKKFISQFNAWVNWLDNIGYNTYYEVLNAKHYGIPQNRERIFAVSIRKDIDNSNFKFPEQIPLTTRLKDILEKNVDERYYIDNDRVNSILYSDAFKEKLLRKIQTDTDVPIRLTNIYDERFGTGYAGNVWDTNGISPTLQTAQGGNRQPLVVEVEPLVFDDYNSRLAEDSSVINTLTTNCGASAPRNGVKIIESVVCEERRDEGIRLFADESCGTLRTIDACGDKRVIEFEVDTIKVRNQTTEFADFTDVAGTLLARDYKGFGNQEMTAIMETYEDVMSIQMRIRKLTTRESFRLMGFSDSDHNKAAKYVSPSARYKQAGNSIVTSCLVAIFNALFLEDYSASYAKKLVDYNS